MSQKSFLIWAKLICRQFIWSFCICLCICMCLEPTPNGSFFGHEQQQQQQLSIIPYISKCEYGF